MSTRDCAKELREIARALDLYQAEHKTAQEMGFVDCDEALAYIKNLEDKIRTIKKTQECNPENVDYLLDQLFHMVDS